jgi:hypothetical protein
LFFGGGGVMEGGNRAWIGYLIVSLERILYRRGEGHGLGCAGVVMACQSLFGYCNREADGCGGMGAQREERRGMVRGSFLDRCMEGG